MNNAKIDRYLGSMRMRDLIDNDAMLLMALSRFGITLGFGEASVETVCRTQGVDTATFLAVANHISFRRVEPGNIDLPSLMAYLENAHAYFLEFCLPRIRRRLIEAIDCSAADGVGLLILKFYDSYTEEVRKHMEHENDDVFAYVRSLLQGHPNGKYSINVFASGHHSIHNKLQELKDLIVRYLPQRDRGLLNAALFDIMNCETDLMMHCMVEDVLFVPAVRELEAHVERQHDSNGSDGDCLPQNGELLSSREREIIACVARGMANKEIADALCLSVNTVTTHRRNIAQKLDIHSPAALAIYAVINGIVSIDDLKQ